MWDADRIGGSPMSEPNTDRLLEAMSEHGAGPRDESGVQLCLCDLPYEECRMAAVVAEVDRLQYRLTELEDENAQVQKLADDRLAEICRLHQLAEGGHGLV